MLKGSNWLKMMKGSLSQVLFKKRVKQLQFPVQSCLNKLSPDNHLSMSYWHNSLKLWVLCLLYKQASSARLGSEERTTNTMCVCLQFFGWIRSRHLWKKSCKLLLLSILLQRHPLRFPCGYKAFLTKQETIHILLICFERKESIEPVSSYAIILKNEFIGVTFSQHVQAFAKRAGLKHKNGQQQHS